MGLVMAEQKLEHRLPGRIVLWYGHLRWTITILASLLWLSLGYELGSIPVVAVVVYVVAHYPALMLATYGCRGTFK